MVSIYDGQIEDTAAHSELACLCFVELWPCEDWNTF